MTTAIRRMMTGACALGVVIFSAANGFAERPRPVLSGTPAQLGLNQAQLTNVTQLIVVLKEEAAAPIKNAKLAGKSLTAKEEISFPKLGKLKAKSSDHWKAEKAKKSKGEAISKAERSLNNLFTAELQDTSPSNIIAVVEELKKDKRVEYAEPDYPVQVYSVPNDPEFWEQYSLHNSGQGFHASIPYGNPAGLTTNYPGTPGADIGWLEVYTNANFPTNRILVGVVDTGVDYTHEDMAGQVWINTNEIPGNLTDDDGNGYIDDIYGYNTADMDNDVMADHMHGAHVAGTIAAATENNWGMAGINPNARIVTAKMFAHPDGPLKGSATSSSGALGIRYVAEQGAKIQNNSWGGGGYSQAIQDAIELATDRGCAVFFASGNSNTDAIDYPAFQDYVTAVDSTDKDDIRSFFSNYGWWTDICAPGSDICSIYSHDPLARVASMARFIPPNNTNLITISGTSMATPTAVGAVSLLISKRPGMPAWIYGRVAEASANTNIYSIPANTNYYIGAGRVDIPSMLAYDKTNAFLFARVDKKGGLSGLSVERSTTNAIFARVGVWTHPITNLTVEVVVRADSINDIEVVPGKSVWNVGDLAAGQDVSTTNLAVRVKANAQMYMWNYIEIHLKQGTNVLDVQTTYLYIEGQNIAGFRLSDVDHDGTMDLFKLYKDSTKIMRTDPLSGAVVWTFDTASVYSNAYRVEGFKCGNLVTNDSAEELLVTIYDGSATNDYLYMVVSHTGSVEMVSMKNYSGGYVPRSPALVDVDRDGGMEVVFSDRANIELRAIRNGAAQTLWSTNSSAMFGSTNGGTYYNSRPAIGDFDGNGKADIAVLCSVITTNYYVANAGVPHYIRVFYDVSNSVSRTALITIPKEIGLSYHSSQSGLVAGDIDNDGKCEFLFVNQAFGKYSTADWRIGVFAYKQDGSPAPGWPVVLEDPNQLNYEEPVLSDINKDSYLEVFYLARAGYNGALLHGFDYRGDRLAGWPIQAADPADQYPTEPVITDVDGDGAAELLYLCNVNLDLLGESFGTWNPAWPYSYELMAKNLDGTTVRGYPKSFSGDGGFWEIYGMYASQAPLDVQGSWLTKAGDTNQFVIINDTLDIQIVDTMTPHNPDGQEWVTGFHDNEGSATYPMRTNTFRVAFGCAYPWLMTNSAETFYSTVFGAAPGSLVYSWDFNGDGVADLVTTNASAATNTYGGVANYDVTLTVSNTVNGQTATLTQSNLVSVVARPAALFSMTPSSSTNVPVAVQFVSGSSNVNPRYSSFRWSLGDSTNVYTQERFTHTYWTAGTYQVTLSVTNDYGALGKFGSTTSQTLTVSGSFTYTTNFYVSPSGAGRYPYSSWENAANSLADVADAVKNYGAPCTVWVTNGHYYETRLASFSSNIAVRSVNGPCATIIDGSHCGDLFTIGSYGLVEGLTFQKALISPSTVNPTIWRNCRFRENAGYGALGGGFDSCVIESNRGGGVRSLDMSLNMGWVSNSVVRYNQVDNDKYTVYGNVYNCLIHDNTGFSLVFGQQLVNSTVVNNDGGSYPILQNQTRLWNNVVWSNRTTYKTDVLNLPLYAYDYGDQVEALNNILEKYNAASYYWSDWVGTGTISNNPQFVNFAARDFRLRTNSPGINAGYNHPALLGWTTNAVMARVDFGPSNAVYDLVRDGACSNNVVSSVNLDNHKLQQSSTNFSGAWIGFIANQWAWLKEGSGTSTWLARQTNEPGTLRGVGETIVFTNSYPSLTLSFDYNYAFGQSNGELQVGLYAFNNPGANDGVSVASNKIFGTPSVSFSNIWIGLTNSGGWQTYTTNLTLNTTNTFYVLRFLARNVANTNTDHLWVDKIKLERTESGFLTTEPGWNNFTAPSNNPSLALMGTNGLAMTNRLGQPLTLALMDVSGTNLAGYVYNYKWGWAETTGMASTNAGYPASAQRDYIYHTVGLSGYTGEKLPYVSITGLDTGKVYAVKIFASTAKDWAGQDLSIYYAPKVAEPIYNLPYNEGEPMPYPYEYDQEYYRTYTNEHRSVFLGPWPAIGVNTSIQVMVRKQYEAGAVGVLELLDIQPALGWAFTNQLDVDRQPRVYTSPTNIDMGCYEWPGGFLPRCAFTQITNTARVNMDTVTLAGGASDFDGTITNLTVDFGDGYKVSVVGTNLSAAHVYTNDNVYGVHLTAWDNEGRSHQVCGTVEVIKEIPNTPGNLIGLASNPVYNAISVRWQDESVESGYVLERTPPADPETIIVDDDSVYFRSEIYGSSNLWWVIPPGMMTNGYGRTVHGDNRAGYYGNKAIFKPPFPRDRALYHAYEWHPTGVSTGLTIADFRITHAYGTDTLLVDQSVKGGQWNYLGTWEFALEDTVEIYATFNRYDFYVYTVADALKFVRAEYPDTSLPLAANTTNYTDTGLTPDSTYWYRLMATNVSGASPWTPWLPVYLPNTDACPVAVMTIQSNVLLHGYSWRFSATNSSDNGSIVSYRWNMGDNYEGAIVAGASYSNYNYVFEYDGTYWVELTVTDNRGQSSSTGQWITVTGGIPAAPANFTAVPASETMINLSWSDRSYNELAFELQRDSAPLVVKAAGAVSHADAGLTPGSVYIYRIRSTNEYGASAWVYATTNTYDFTLPTISDVLAAQNGSNVVVMFSEDMDETVAETTGNYSINNGLMIYSAVRDPADAGRVTLLTSPLSTGLLYTITINNVKDLYNNVVATNSQDTFILNLIAHNAVRFDFGTATYPWVDGWNSLTAFTNGYYLANAEDTNNVATTVGLYIASGFAGRNAGGISVNSPRYPTNVVIDNFYLTNGMIATVVVSNLNPALEYNLGFLGSYDTTASRKMKYIAGGVTVTNDSWDNTTNVSWITKVNPAADGSIAISMTPANANAAYNGYLSLLEVVWGSDYVPSAGNSILTSTNAVTVPEGGTAQLNVRLSVMPSGSFTVQVARVSGYTNITVQSGAALVFNSSNWTNWQTVTLAAAEDGDWINGSAVIRCSSPSLGTVDVTATEADNDLDPSTRLPFSEPFEDRTAGAINAQYGWVSGTNAVVQTNSVHGGTQALQIQSDTAGHSFNNGTNRVAFSWWMKPVAGIAPTSGLSGAAAVIWVGNNGNVTVFSNTTVVMLPVKVSSNVWNKFEVEVSYASNVWKLSVNGTNAADNLALYSARSAFSEISLIGPISQIGLFDDINISNVVAAAQSSAFDNWLIAYYGTTNVNVNGLSSNGVNTILQAYIAGLNPNDPSARFAVTENRPVLAGRLLAWPAVSGRVYTVYWTSNLLSSFQSLQSNVPWTGNIYTDAVHGADGKSFYKIEVRMEP